MSWESVLLPLVGILSLGLTTLIGWGVLKWGSFVDSKIDNEYANGVLKRLAEAVALVVKDLKQTVVDVLKEDEEWDEDTAAEVKARALSTIKEYVGPEGLEAAMEILGLSDGALLDKLIGSMIEAQVGDLKTEEV